MTDDNQTDMLLAKLAEDYHGGSERATIAAALAVYSRQLADRELVIRRAVLRLADPDRAEESHELLSALLDETAARAIAAALTELTAR